MAPRPSRASVPTYRDLCVYGSAELDLLEAVQSYRDEGGAKLTNQFLNRSCVREFMTVVMVDLLGFAGSTQPTGSRHSGGGRTW